MTKKFPTLGVCYYPEHWPTENWPQDAARMVSCGITMVRIAEFAWSRIEPRRGRFDFEWLDQAMDVLADAGLQIIMCTPTATPPKWLVDEMPDMVAIDALGNPRKWGSRRHYDFSHAGYRTECARIVEILGKRYGDHRAVIAWQIDNEYGCHDTTLSYSRSALTGFQNWLAQKYQSPDALNRAWGSAFWSMEVSDFAQVELPNLTVTEPNPAHILDFRRYASQQVVDFNRLQCSILRKLSPNRDLVHNFMARFLEFDHFDVSNDLDIASWDSYPLGNLERFGRNDQWKNRYLRAGDPDFQAFHHDLYRGCGRGRMWVMEQQPGPVNWAPWNPAPYPGMVRLWSHEAFAHGAEVVSYFRWRQAPFAQEQFHAGLNRPDGSADLAYEEVRQVSAELTALPQASPTQAKIALVFDYPSQWATEIQPQGADYDGFELVLEFYRGLRGLGQSLDIVSSSSDLDGYRLIVVPHLLFPDEALVKKLRDCGAQVVFGPRCGSRTAAHQIPWNLPPGVLQDLMDIRVLRVESLRPGVSVPLQNDGSFSKWFEYLSCGDQVHIEVETGNGEPAYVTQGNFGYLAGWPDPIMIEQVLRGALVRQGLQFVETGEDLRLRDRSDLRIILNYGQHSKDASHLIAEGDEVLIGDNVVPAAGVTIIKRSNNPV